jgi:hypothetical protein
MPVERQAERLRTPLRPRDRRVLQIAGVAAVLAAAGGIYAGIADTGGKPVGANCISVSLPNVVGGSTVERCGPAAARLCRSTVVRYRSVADACRRHGFTVGGR